MSITQTLTKIPVRLEVPLDYSKPVAGDVFKLALVKVPANTTVPYKGTFILMEGLQSNVDFTTTVDQTTGLYVGVLYQNTNLQGYDIVSWDTRGVGHSTPVLQCFANDAAENAYAIVEREGPQLGAFNGTYPPTTTNIQDNIQKVSAHQQTFGPGCQQYYGHYLPHVILLSSHCLSSICWPSIGTLEQQIMPGI